MKIKPVVNKTVHLSPALLAALGTVLASCDVKPTPGKGGPSEPSEEETQHVVGKESPLRRTR